MQVVLSKGQTGQKGTRGSGAENGPIAAGLLLPPTLRSTLTLETQTEGR